MTRIRWAHESLNECGEYSANHHRCIKDIGHLTNPTNDDHQCCCGNTWENEN